VTNTDETERQRLARIRPGLEKRANIYRIVRSFFCDRGFLEVETPVRAPTIAPELHIEPFESEGYFLSTSPELYMKRLLSAEYEKLFQISHCFRKDEKGKQHNPEFIMLEWYRTGGDYMQMIDDTEQLVVHIADTLHLGMHIPYQGHMIDITPPWLRVTVKDAFMKHTGWDPVTAGDLSNFDIDLVTKIMPAFPMNRPIILMDYPASMASLSRINSSNPQVAERAEVFIGGMELANAFSELTDPDQQRKRFQSEIEQISKERSRTHIMPEKFLDSLMYLQPCGGIALGIDRLIMLFNDTNIIDDVVAFPEA